MPEQPPARAPGKVKPQPKPRVSQGGAKGAAAESQGPQATGGSGGSPPRAGTEGGPGRPAAPASRGKARKAKGGAGPADSAGARVRPRASQPAKLAEAAPAPAAEAAASRESQSRLDVRKTYKLFIGGAFPRSESGRSYPVSGPDGTLLAHAARASRKDARDAVVAARKAGPGWAWRDRLQPGPGALPGGGTTPGPRGAVRRGDRKE